MRPALRLAVHGVPRTNTARIVPSPIYPSSLERDLRLKQSRRHCSPVKSIAAGRLRDRDPTETENCPSPTKRTRDELGCFRVRYVVWRSPKHRTSLTILSETDAWHSKLCRRNGDYSVLQDVPNSSNTSRFGRLTPPVCRVQARPLPRQNPRSR